MKKFKLHWGWAIAIFYSSFVIFYIIFVIKSKDVDHSLVRNDYYNEDIHFQEKFDKIENTKNLEKDLFIKKNAKNVEFQFPDNIDNISGTVWFYKPDNEVLDFKKEIKVNTDNIYVLDIANIKNSGYWKVKVDWVGSGTKYYKEEKLNL